MTTDSTAFWFRLLALVQREKDLILIRSYQAEFFLTISFWSDLITQISIWSDLTIQHFFLIRFYRQYSFLSIHQSHTIKDSSSIVFLWSRSWNPQTRILRFPSIPVLKPSKKDVFRQYHFSLISVQKFTGEDLIAVQYCLLLISV